MHLNWVELHRYQEDKSVCKEFVHLKQWSITGQKKIWESNKQYIICLKYSLNNLREWWSTMLFP